MDSPTPLVTVDSEANAQATVLHKPLKSILKTSQDTVENILGNSSNYWIFLRTTKFALEPLTY